MILFALRWKMAIRRRRNPWKRSGGFTMHSSRLEAGRANPAASVGIPGPLPYKYLK
jgi:hypothetical protein